MIKMKMLLSAALLLSSSLQLCHSFPFESSGESQETQAASTSSPAVPLLFSLPDFKNSSQSPCWNYLFEAGPDQNQDQEQGQQQQKLKLGPSLKAAIHRQCVTEAQNGHNLPSLIYGTDYEPVRVAFCAAMYQAVGCFRRFTCTLCGSLHARYQQTFSSNGLAEGENLQLFAWNGTAYEQAMIEAIEEKAPFCFGELPTKASAIAEEEVNRCQSAPFPSAVLERSFFDGDIDSAFNDIDSPLARLNVVFDEVLGQARFTPANETMTTFVTPTSTYVMIVCFVVVSAAFVGAIVWLMMKLNDDDRIQKENSVRPMVTPEDVENGGRPRGGGGGSSGQAGGGNLTKGVVDGKSILTIDKMERGKAPTRTAKLSSGGQKKTAKSASGGIKKLSSASASGKQ